MRNIKEYILESSNTEYVSNFSIEDAFRFLLDDKSSTKNEIMN